MIDSNLGERQFSFIPYDGGKELLMLSLCGGNLSYFFHQQHILRAHTCSSADLLQNTISN